MMNLQSTNYTYYNLEQLVSLESGNMNDYDDVRIHLY